MRTREELSLTDSVTENHDSRLPEMTERTNDSNDTSWRTDSFKQIMKSTTSANKARQQYTPMGLFLFLYSYQKKLYTMKVLFFFLCWFNAGFRLTTNLKTAWLGSTCQGTTNIMTVLLLLASHNTVKLLYK